MKIKNKKKAHFKNFQTTDFSNFSKIQKNLKNKKMLNNYNVLETLGKGSFGKVKKLIENTTKKNFAVKIIKMKKLRKKYKIKGKNLNSEIKKEIAILKKLKHPNIIKLKEVLYSQKKDNIYFIMEFLNSGQIEKIANLKNPSKTQKKDLKKKMYKIFDSIRYLHDFAKIAHFDLKEENILNCEKNSVKIIDFGCSVFLPENKMVKNSCNGTLAYLPPEVLLKKEKMVNGEKVDIWALGILAYFLVTGNRVFFDFSNFDDFSRKIQFLKFLEKLFFPEWVCENFKKIIKSCLSIDPEKRPSAKELMKFEFFEGFEDFGKYEEVVVGEDEIENSVCRVVENTFFASAKMLAISSKLKKKMTLLK